jgi:prepilin-type N-terminal cleavage/methylation domain-containing protein
MRQEEPGSRFATRRRLRHPVRRPGDAGFTMVELLVTVAILIVLAALAFVVFTQVRASGHLVQTTNNLKQLQAANAIYAGEHNGAYVSAFAFDEDGKNLGYWYENTEFLGYYRGEVGADASLGVRRRVPFDYLDPVAVRARQARHDFIGASYGYNITALPGGANNTPGTNRVLRTTQVRTPSQTCAFATATDQYIVHAGRFRWQGSEAVEGKSRNQKMAYRYNGKAVAVYYDGRVGQVSMDDMRDFDQRGRSRHPFWGAP